MIAHSLRRLLASGLMQNIGAMYLIRCAAYVAPLVTLPWLARVLGPPGLGLLAFVQGFGACITLVVEYGFSFSATQQVSVHRHDPEKLSRLLAGVQGGKTVLAAGCALAALSMAPFLDVLHGHTEMLLAGVICAIGQAFVMTWFFLGVERMLVQSILEAVLRISAAGAVLLFVRTPEDGWKVLGLQAAAAWLTAGAGLIAAYRGVPVHLPTWALVREALTSGRSALYFRVAETSYTSCNSLLLGFVCPPEAVGVFAGAEKIARAILTALLDPVQRAVFPGVSRALAVSREKAARMVRISALVTVSLSTVISGALVVAAPFVVRILLGPGYEASVLPLRILLIVPVAVALKWAIGLNWMVPMGRSWAFNVVIFCSAVFHLSAGFVLATVWDSIGMAVAVALTEAAIPACIYILLRRWGLDPFRLAKATPPATEFQHDPKTEVPCC